ncbi:Ubiquitin-protein ligase, partial [Mortierella sp. AD031]
VLVAVHTIVPVVAPAIVPSSRKRSSAMTAEISTSHVKDGRFHPYLKTQSLLRSSNHIAPPVVTRSRSGASGSFNKETRDLAWYLRQSKTSTSQKRPTVSKSSFKVAGVMDATTAKDGTVHTSPQDTEQSRSSEGASKDQSAEKKVSQGRIPTRGEDARCDNTGDTLSNESNRDDGDQGAGDDDDDDEDDQGGEVDEEGDEDEDDEDEYDHHQQSNDQDGLFPSGGSMSGMVSGIPSRIEAILTNLCANEDPSLQFIALQDLAVLLSVTTENTLAEYFDCDAFVKELVLLVDGTGDGFGDLRNMLSACRCLCKLMETMPASIGCVVHGDAVPVLCTKLIDIQDVDLAGEALIALEKIAS